MRVDDRSEGEGLPRRRTAPSSDANFAVSAPKITLPKGGGAISGIGAKFAANPVTGTGSMTVPVFASPSRSGFGPQLSLSYESGAGNSPFGFGWSLSFPSITRRTDKGLPKYLDAHESDTFILSGVEDLVPVVADGTDCSQRQPVDSPASEPGNIVQRYLKYIKYGNRSPRQCGEDLTRRTDWMFEVVFDYGEHDEAEAAPALPIDFAILIWPLIAAAPRG